MSFRACWKVMGKVLLVIAIMAAVLVLGWQGCCYKHRVGLRHSVLPAGVTEYRDYIWMGYATDVYCLKARMTFDAFQEYWVRHGYVTASRDIADWAYATDPHLPSWWDPQRDQSPVYCTPDSVPKSFRAIKYKNGHMYLLDWNEYLW
jgi:hypothetical protein